MGIEGIATTVHDRVMSGFDNKDILTAIVIPLVMSIVVGIPLAVYTGVICSRLSEFRQTIRAAADFLLAIEARPLEQEERAIAELTYRQRVLALTGVLVDQGQVAASAAVEQRLNAQREDLDKRLKELVIAKLSGQRASSGERIGINGVARYAEILRIEPDYYWLCLYPLAKPQIRVIKAGADGHEGENVI